MRTARNDKWEAASGARFGVFGTWGATDANPPAVKPVNFSASSASLNATPLRAGSGHQGTTSTAAGEGGRSHKSRGIRVYSAGGEISPEVLALGMMNNVATHLLRVEQKLREQPVFLRGSGPAVDDPGYQRETAELDQLSRHLKLQIRNLQNHLHSLSAREQGLWNLPRDRRFGAAAAISQQQAEADRLLRNALNLRKLVDDLMRRNCHISDAEIAAKVGEYVKEVQEMGHAVHQASHGGPAYLPMQQAHFGITPEMATIGAYAALRALSHFLKGKKWKAA